jgi:hypothetical protein
LQLPRSSLEDLQLLSFLKHSTDSHKSSWDRTGIRKSIAIGLRLCCIGSALSYALLQRVSSLHAKVILAEKTNA